MTSPTEGRSGAGVLVTGAAKGIGAATAALFAEHGARVYPTDVDSVTGVASAAKYGAADRFRVLDVRDEDAWEGVVADMEADGVPLEILVNSAGAAIKAPLAETTVDGFRHMLELNLVGTFLGVRAAARHMRPGGAVVNISSLRGVLATAELGAYGASKFGVRALTRVAAIELADKGIRVNDVCPGSIETEITAVPRSTGRGGECASTRFIRVSSAPSSCDSGTRAPRDMRRCCRTPRWDDWVMLRQWPSWRATMPCT